MRPLNSTLCVIGGKNKRDLTSCYHNAGARRGAGKGDAVTIPLARSWVPDGKGDMSLNTLDNRADELAGLWMTHAAENRARVVREIRGNGLLAIWVFEHLPPRGEANHRNELAFALTPALWNGSKPKDGTHLSALSDQARELAELWMTRAEEARALVLRQIHDNGALAVWAFDHLPPDGESTARFELGKSLMAFESKG